MPPIVTNLTSPTVRMPGAKTPVTLWKGDCADFLERLPRAPLFDLVITSPPYNVGKSYERRNQRSLEDYLAWQGRIFRACVERLKPTGSICWQVGTHITGRSRSPSVLPLDILLYPHFAAAGATLRNRIVWQFGHGLHAKHRFSGRHETVLWYTLTNDYVFNLDAVRVPQKYPGKRSYRPGEGHGRYSGNVLGKNPSDVWMDIPNVKGKHLEKTDHPCQFPVALAERFINGLTNADALVFDPFAGVASSGVAALCNKRRFWGCEISAAYVKIGLDRLAQAMAGTVAVRPLEKAIFDPALAGADLRYRALEV